MKRVESFEHDLGGYLWERMQSVDGVVTYGPPPTARGGRAALCSFNVEGLHPTDVSTILDQQGFAIRSGHHCTQVRRHARPGPASSLPAAPAG